MKLLLDECLDQQFRHDIGGHDVYSVGYLGWDGTKNGRLLARAAAGGFDGMVTTDRAIEHQQNLAELPLSVCILIGSESNNRRHLRLFASNLLAALDTPPAKPSIVHIYR